MTDVHFTADAAFDRALFWERGQSVRYLVARLRARRKDDRRPAQRPPLNIALVIDASGSMAGGKLEAAKQAALGLAERLTEQDRLTVVSFASDVIVHVDGAAMTAPNAAKVQTAIKRLTTRGSTFLSGGWFAGVERAARLAEVDPRLTPRVILLSDGHANRGIIDAGELGLHAAELRQRGVLTSCLGIGDGYDEMLLRSIAENGGGRLHDAELTEEISSVLLGELDDIFATVVEDARIRVEFPAGVRVEPLARESADQREGAIELNLGPVQEGIERAAVFKVTCPAARPGEELVFTVSARGRAVDDGAPLEVTGLKATLTAAEAEANNAQPRDKALAALVARNWSAHVVTTAARLNRDGAFGQAERFVWRELEHFRRYVRGLEGGREMVRDLQILAERARMPFSSRVRKEMVLQSQLRTEARLDRRGAGKDYWRMRLERGD